MLIVKISSSRSTVIGRAPANGEFIKGIGYTRIVVFVKDLESLGDALFETIEVHFGKRKRTSFQSNAGQNSEIIQIGFPPEARNF